jgi:Protein of unknown function (DUF3800)
MLVFVDESGDPGLKLERGSSEIFVVTLVMFESSEEALRTEKRINDLRAEMGMHSSFEFKFNKLQMTRRVEFLKTVSAFEFIYFSIVINKAKITSKGMSYKESFYKYVCSLVFENAKHLLKESIIVIDGSGSREFRRQLQKYLKTRMNDQKDGKNCIKKVKLEDSKKNNLLQLADMVCGAIARCYKPKTNADECRELISSREGYVQFWPK